MRSITPSRRVVTLLAACVMTIVTPQAGRAGEQQEARYQGTGAHVIRVAGTTVRDDGSMTCSYSTGAGNGGTCLRFDPANPSPAVRVVDAALGPAVPFQVCLDNNGDGFCTSPERGPCGDDIFFSHADGGAFFNPLAVPGGFRPGCPGGPYPGYVVFICEGIHVDTAGPHSHTPTTGVAMLVSGGSGTGDFCGGTQENVSRKQYTITP
ncbi:MAG TPA: hypothetical protein VNQ77_02080 [Frankiaceae bacterium]|nr:hypothetical protein [Frankiaceae bacterium]